MPGLIRGVARTAVVAGTASAVSGRVQRHQAEKFSERDQAIAALRHEVQMMKQAGFVMKPHLSRGWAYPAGENDLDEYKARIPRDLRVAHVTVEVNRPGGPAPS